MVRTAACEEFGGCSWDDGATALLLSQLFYFFASVFTRCMREPRYIRKKNEAAAAPASPKQEDSKKVPAQDAAAENKAANDAEAEETEEGDKA
jgi:hypothetical protein